jgi:hypothetical protein
MSQGQINAKVVRLDEEDQVALKEYGATLTEDQKRQARNHLMTVRAIKKHAQRFNK